MKRANGTGTIMKLSGNRRRPYMVRISVRDKYGRIVQKPLSFHEKSADAQAALDKYNAQKAQGLAPQTEAVNFTVSDVYKLWSARKYQRVGEASVKSYKATWNHLYSISKMKLRDVTIDHLQAIIDSREKKGFSRSTLNNIKILMSALYDFAMMRDIVHKDYSAFVEMPTVEAKHKKGAFSEVQIKKLEIMAEHGFPWADTALILCYTGFRIGEMLNLSPFGYDAEAQTLTGGSKTAAGKNRIVPIHPKIMPYVRKRAAQKGEYIVCNESGKRVTESKFRENFRAVAAVLGTPEATPHWCRHTFATRLHVAGADELCVKRLLGHANKDVTEHYTHTDIELLKTTVSKLA